VKVLFDHPIFQMQRFGGISRYFHELIRHLVPLPEVEAHAFLGFHVNGYGTDRIPGLASAVGWPRPALRGLDRLLDPLADRWLDLAHDLSRFDVLHRTYYDPRDLARGRCRTVLTVYDMIHELHPRDDRQRAWMEARKRPAVAHADAVIAISESTKQDLIRLYGTSASQIHVIPLASSLTGTGAPEPLFERPYLLFVGGRGGYKNFELLARTYAARPEWVRELDLVCFGGGAFTPGERQLVHALGIAPQVRYLEGPDDVLETLYRHARMLVYPSRYEGFGLPPLEAMQLGCPVVVARTSSLPEVVGEAGEYVEPDSPDSLEAAIARLLDDSSHRAELIRRGHARARRFSWTQCAEQTLAVYRSVAG
jgi:glycosyltransferase involved in cell wall biosynthesis